MGICALDIKNQERNAQYSNLSFCVCVSLCFFFFSFCSFRLQQAEDGNQHQWYKKMYNTIHKVHEGGECIYECFCFCFIPRAALKESRENFNSDSVKSRTDKGAKILSGNSLPFDLNIKKY